MSWRLPRPALMCQTRVIFLTYLRDLTFHSFLYTNHREKAHANLPISAFLNCHSDHK